VTTQNPKLASDYHTHPQAHQLRPYTLELLRPWVERCRECGIRSVAFTDHDRYHEGVRFDVIDALREENPDIEILAGIELDNDPTTSAAGVRWVEKNWEQLDFVLGSVHYLPGETEMFDRSDSDSQLIRRGPESAYEEYVKELEKLIQRGFIDCLAHLDLIKIHKLFPAEYDPGVRFRPILELAASHRLAIEINTAGWRKPVGEQYPALDILRVAKELGLPITISSDAHSYAQIAEDYVRLGAILDEAGITEIARFSRHEIEPW
jgi:histidinol-phosphatase (PHP family)